MAREPAPHGFTVGTWTETGEPYLLLELPAEQVRQMEPDFETAMDGFIDVVEHPNATIEHNADLVVLVLYGRGYGSPLPVGGWPETGECEIIVVTAGKLPAEPSDLEPALGTLLSTGQALLAVAAISTPTSRGLMD